MLGMLEFVGDHGPNDELTTLGAFCSLYVTEEWEKVVGMKLMDHKRYSWCSSTFEALLTYVEYWLMTLTDDNIKKRVDHHQDYKDCLEQIRIWEGVIHGSKKTSRFSTNKHYMQQKTN